MTKKRGGFTLIETLVAGIILATAFTVAARMLIAASAQRKAMDLRQIALIEAGNVMERLAAEPWPKLDAAEFGTWKLCPQAARALPRAKLEIQIKSMPGKPAAKEPAAKRVTVIVSYGGDDNRPAREVRLVAWRYEHAPATSTPPRKRPG
jgi:Tfp pilus assembly protein PilV